MYAYLWFYGPYSVNFVNCCVDLGGLDEDSLSPFIYYIDRVREPIMRRDLPQYRPLIDEFGISEWLLVHSIERQLIERGLQLLIFIL